MQGQQIYFIFGFTILLFGCSLFRDYNQDKPYLITISASDTITYVQEPIFLTVTIENLSDKVISWGSGSSTCQLDANVRIHNDDYRATGLRICPRDFVSWELDPGETRTESWNWIGEYYHDARFDTLESGTYTLYGAAGNWLSDSPIEIEVIN